MVELPASSNDARFEFPDIYIILLGFILLASALTWVVPAGAYQRTLLPTGRETVVPGSYREVEATPIGLMGVVTAIPVGLKDASDVVFLVLLVGGSVGVVRRTGVMELGIRWLISRLGGRDELLIPVLMGTFGLIAAFIGTPELGIAYLPIVLPLMMRLGYDTVTATALVLLSSTLGYAFGITAPATIGTGHLVAELPMFSAAWFRASSFFLVLALSIAFVLRYARRVKKDPSLGLNPEEDEKLRRELLAGADEGKIFTGRQRLAALVAPFLFLAIIASVLRFGLGFDEISGLFVMMALATALVAGQRGNGICTSFNDSFREMLVAALICGVARGVGVVLTEGGVMDTVIFHMAGLVESLPGSLTAVGILLTQTLFNFLVPSGSGQVLLTLPILVPLADLIGVTRQVVVLATHWGDGISNILFPTSGYFVATLVIGRVRFATWVRFYLPFFWVVLAIAAAGLVIAQSIALGPF